MTELFDELTESTKRVAAALKGADVPFLLAGGIAAWARGGPPTEHDIDIVVRPDDAERALAALTDAGMRAERPPEGWLFKAFDGEVMIDLIFGPEGIEVDEALFERADELTVRSAAMQVMAAEDILISKLMALAEHDLDYDGVLELVRPLREQIDWERVRRTTESSPYAKAFFTLVQELGLVSG